MDTLNLKVFVQSWKNHFLHTGQPILDTSYTCDERVLHIKQSSPIPWSRSLPNSQLSSNELSCLQQILNQAARPIFNRHPISSGPSAHMDVMSKVNLFKSSCLSHAWQQCSMPCEWRRYRLHVLYGWLASSKQLIKLKFLPSQWRKRAPLKNSKVHDHDVDDSYN